MSERSNVSISEILGDNYYIDKLTSSDYSPAVGDTVTVIDIMGNSKTLKTENGKVKIELSGTPIYVYGVC